MFQAAQNRRACEGLRSLPPLSELQLSAIELLEDYKSGKINLDSFQRALWGYEHGLECNWEQLSSSYAKLRIKKA